MGKKIIIIAVAVIVLTVGVIAGFKVYNNSIQVETELSDIDSSKPLSEQAAEDQTANESASSKQETITTPENDPQTSTEAAANSKTDTEKETEKSTTTTKYFF